MTTVTRLIVAVAVLLLCRGRGVAQLPTAPPPHPPLDQVVQEYLRLGLPLPPPTAELVRLEVWKVVDEKDDRLRENYLLVFRLSPQKPGAPRYLGSDGDYWNDRMFEPRSVERAEPVPESLHLVEVRSEDDLCLAVQCKLRGWHDLARALYQRALTVSSLVMDNPSPILQLREQALTIQYRRLKQRGSDRSAILRRLKELAAEEESFRTPENERLFRQLELTIAMRKSKPGTVEALIDDLIEYWVDDEDPSNRAGQEAYWKLVELGFDAVPALIEHVGDDRLSRAYSNGSLLPLSFTHDLTVGHLCSRLLFDLSGRTIGGGYWERRGDRLDPERVRTWFTEAKTIGEEKWLVAHAVPTDNGGPITNQKGRPETTIVRAIGARYPAQLPAIYRAMLRKPHSYELRDFVDEILTSKLTREQKVKLFEEGVTHKDVEHRLDALEGLAGIDPPLFRTHLLLTLKEIPLLVKAAKEESRWYFELVALVLQADHRDCSDALATAARELPITFRTSIMYRLAPEALSRFGTEISHRRERVRILMQFLDDRSIDVDEADGTGGELRDYVASQLTELVGIRLRRVPEYDWMLHNPKRGPLSRLIVREAVRQAATRELAREGN